MRLLFVLDNLGSGGAQRQMTNLALELSRRGHQIELFVYYPGFNHFAGRLQEAGIPIHSRPKRGRFSLAPLRGLRQLVKRHPYDAMLAFLPTPSFYAEMAHLGMGPQARRVAFGNPIRHFPLVVSERFMYTSESLPPVTWVLQQAHRLADHITVNSHHQRERMERMFPWMRGRLTTIYNGVDLARFAPQGESNGYTGRLRLLVLSSVVPKKNAQGLVRALARCRELYDDTCTVRWAGVVTPDAVSQTEFAEADRLLRDLGLRERWEWLGERQDIPELLGACDALIHPSFYEGLPNAICEALACGKPVLASAVCDHPRLVQEGVTGFLFDPGNADDIAHAIYKCHLLSVQERVQMGRKARRYAEHELSLDHCARQYEELLSRLTAGRGLAPFPGSSREKVPVPASEKGTGTSRRPGPARGASPPRLGVPNAKIRVGGPLPTAWSRPHWRILCYHTVPDDLADAFRAQLTAFREMGFWFTDFDQGLRLCQGQGFTRPTMTVTFDDAYLTAYENALPILEELGIKGFHYLIVDYVNKGSTYLAANPLPAMTWDHVRDWVRMGHGVGSHTFTHAHLQACTDSRLIDECARSKQVLEEKLQVPICHFSYPCGYHSRRTYRLIKAGRLYDSAATIDRGRMWVGHDLFKLRRDVCDPQWPFESLVRVMRLADRWYWLRHVRRCWQRYRSQGHGRRD